MRPTTGGCTQDRTGRDEFVTPVSQSRPFAALSHTGRASTFGEFGSAAVAAAVQIHNHLTMAGVYLSRSNAILARVGA